MSIAERLAGAVTGLSDALEAETRHLEAGHPADRHLADAKRRAVAAWEMCAADLRAWLRSLPAADRPAAAAALDLPPRLAAIDAAAARNRAALAVRIDVAAQLMASLADAARRAKGRTLVTYSAAGRAGDGDAGPALVKDCRA
jgi:hypothetical protein